MSGTGPGVSRPIKQEDSAEQIEESISANYLNTSTSPTPIPEDMIIQEDEDTMKLMKQDSGDAGSASNTSPKAGGSASARQKRTSLACIRCRARHIRCPGGDPCKKCQLAKTKCEYVEADKKIVVSMKYLSKLHDDIARLKKDNAMLRNSLKEEKNKIPPGIQSQLPQQPPQLQQLQQNSLAAQPVNTFTNNIRYSVPNNIDTTNQNTEVIQPSLDKHGRLIQSRTGEKVYVGSSSMTLFGLEIQNMVPSFVSSSLLSSGKSTSANSSPGGLGTPKSTAELAPEASTPISKRETEILEKEGNAYKITLAKTNTRPGLSINFTLPSYSYAMLLVDTFVNYNDGCFYFFNEGLVKRFLMNLYSGNAHENKKIFKRNLSMNKGPAKDENSIKKDADDNTILETIWFCKILLIFAIGEMYLGTESDIHIKKSRTANMESKRAKAKQKGKEKRDTLPGSGFFYQSSELFTGLFASGAIDNVSKDGGIEVMLLYAFYLQVADCTIASYFYFGLALRSTLILGWHVDADKENLNRFELEHRRRIWWTVYMYERMLSSKAGLPLSFADDSVSTELPIDFNNDLSDFPRDENDVRGFYIFPSAEYINNCVTITQINAIILSSLYTKQPTFNILPVVSDLVHKLMTWKNSLPDFLKIDFSSDNFRVSRLIVNLMTEYFQGMNLAVRPLLFHFATKKLKELQAQNSLNKYVDLTKYSKNVLTLLNASFQASINTIKSIWALLPENMVALFGWMDREYLFTSASTLILFNASFGVHDATKDHLDHALTIFTKMKRLGNYPAALRRAQLLKLIRVLDFNGVMNDLLIKHDDDMKDLEINNEAFLKDQFNDHINEVNQISNSNIHDDQLNSLDNELNRTMHPVQSLRSDLDFRAHDSPRGLIPQDPVFEAPPPPETTTLNNESFNYNISIPGGAGASNNGAHSAGGDVYTNSDLAGIEGLTYLDEEQKLWNEITNDAVWLNVAGGNPNQPPTNSNFDKSEYFKRPSVPDHDPLGGMNFANTPNPTNSQGEHPNPVAGVQGQVPNNNGFGIPASYYGGLGSGGYSDIINSEFQDMMD